jgi:hypothetical protein
MIDQASFRPIKCVIANFCVRYMPYIARKKSPKRSGFAHWVYRGKRLLMPPLMASLFGFGCAGPMMIYEHEEDVVHRMLELIEAELDRPTQATSHQDTTPSSKVDPAPSKATTVSPSDPVFVQAIEAGDWSKACGLAFPKSQTSILESADIEWVDHRQGTYILSIWDQWQDALSEDVHWGAVHRLLKNTRSCEALIAQEIWLEMFSITQAVSALRLDTLINQRRFTETFDLLKTLKTSIPSLSRSQEWSSEARRAQLMLWRRGYKEAQAQELWGEAWAYGALIMTHQPERGRLQVKGELTAENMMSKALREIESDHYYNILISSEDQRLTDDVSSHFLTLTSPTPLGLQINFDRKRDHSGALNGGRLDFQIEPQRTRRLRGELSSKTASLKRHKAPQEEDKLALKKTTLTEQETRDFKRRQGEESSGGEGGYRDYSSAFRGAVHLTLKENLKSCQRTKKEGVGSIRYIDQRLDTPNPKWESATKRVEHQQTVYEATQAETEDLTIALRKAKERLDAHIDLQLNPREERLSTAVKQSARWAQEKVNAQEKLNGHQSTLLSAQVDRHQFELLPNMKLNLLEERRVLMRGLNHQVYALVKRSVSLLKPIRDRARLSLIYADEIRAMSSALSTFTSTLLSLSGISFHLQQVDRKLQTPPHPSPPQEIHRTFSATLERLTTRHQEAMRVLSVMQAEIGEVRLKSKSLKTEVDRLRTYLMNTQVRFLHEEEELERLEEEAKVLDEMIKSEVFAVFRYPKTIWTLTCVVSWDLRLWETHKGGEYLLKEWTWEHPSETHNESHLGYVKYKVAYNPLKFTVSSSELRAHARRGLIGRLQTWVFNQYGRYLDELFTLSDSARWRSQTAIVTDLIARLTIVSPQRYSQKLAERLLKEARYAVYSLPKGWERFISEVTEGQENIDAEFNTNIFNPSVLKSVQEGGPPLLLNGSLDEESLPLISPTFNLSAPAPSPQLNEDQVKD